ncbi:MAG TPA: YggS family pyridoxal phosphate-dependent enzyme [Gammaproteobacteria bacterium]|nr:YggS family pyridoxal phosphate-dependent enzyme [Gammaproteobacteria bacterium]
MSIEQALARVRERIAKAEIACGRAPGSVDLLAVSKTRPVADLRAALAAGQHRFGESYVQEALDKIAALAGHDIEWHFIGPLQSNKSRAVAEHFHWCHSIDRLKLARRLSDQRPDTLPPLQICLQVNISGEASKSGFAPEAVAAAAGEIASLPHLQLRGLMAIPARESDVARQRAAFARLRALRDAIDKEHGLALDTLSMGMTGDLEAAIAEGATLVRVGTGIFGERDR